VNQLLPLLLLWLWSERSPGAQLVPSPPQWPTPASPPPPMPAFQPQVPSADTGTPLAALHAASKTPAHAPPPKAKPKAAPPKAKPKPTPAGAALALAKKRAPKPKIPALAKGVLAIP
jgi:hypothetical protein